MKHDHFSQLSGEYAAYRPRYPKRLFDYLSGLTLNHRWAWDVGTGSGQAAVDLTAHFDHVYATDRSENQLRHAVKHARVFYTAAEAEAPPLAPCSIDLVTVAQALHWFDRQRFFAQAALVLRPNGVIAVWCYGRLSLDDDLKSFIHQYYEKIQPYWPPQRKLVDDAYRFIEFPFDSIEVPGFNIECQWVVEDLLGYMRTWTATQRFKSQHGVDPVDEIASEVRKRWDKRRRQVQWPIYLRVGRNKV